MAMKIRVDDGCQEILSHSVVCLTRWWNTLVYIYFNSFYT